MQAMLAFLPEFKIGGGEAVTAPVRGARDRAAAFVDFLDVGGGLFEGGAAFEFLRLVRSPGADLAGAGAGGEIGVGFFVIDERDAALDADLALEAFPIKADAGVAVDFEFFAFAAFAVGIENEAIGIIALHQNRTHGRHAGDSDRRQRHGVGIGGFALFGQRIPFGEKFPGVGGDVAVCIHEKNGRCVEKTKGLVAQDYSLD